MFGIQVDTVCLRMHRMDAVPQVMLFPQISKYVVHRAGATTPRFCVKEAEVLCELMLRISQ